MFDYLNALSNEKDENGNFKYNLSALGIEGLYNGYDFSTLTEQGKRNLIQ
jgi:hypothetical protein